MDRINRITKVSQLPVGKKCLYVFDIDDTLIYDVSHIQSKLIDPATTRFLNKLKHNDNDIIIITARSPTSNRDVQQTVQELEEFGITTDEHYDALYFTKNKGNKLRSHLNSVRKPYDEVYFVDDLMENLRDVRKNVGGVTLYQVVN
jgi:predicted secreted acid phosphatase